MHPKPSLWQHVDRMLRRQLLRSYGWSRDCVTCNLQCKRFYAKKKVQVQVSESLQAEINSEDKTVAKEAKKKIRGLAAAEALALRLSLSEETKALLLNNASVLAKPTLYPDAIYLLDKTVAESIVQKISPKLRVASGSMLFEINPGPGVFTKALLDKGISKLRLYQKKSQFIPYLEDLRKSHNDTFEIITEDFLQLATIAKKDCLMNTNNIDAMFKQVEATEWIAPPPLQIFGILPSFKERSFISYMQRAVQMLYPPFSFGRTEIFLFVSGKEYAYLTSTPHDSYVKYRHFSVINQTFFDIELLHTEPRKSFFPPPAKKIQKILWHDLENMYLVRLTPKKFLFHLLSPNLLSEFVFFSHHHLVKRTRLIIPALEEWIPGCGLHFLKLDLPLHARFGELTPQQVLTVFLHFSSLPEYSDCLFRSAAKICGIDVSNLENKEGSEEEEIEIANLEREETNVEDDEDID